MILRLVACGGLLLTVTACGSKATEEPSESSTRSAAMDSETAASDGPEDTGTTADEAAAQAEAGSSDAPPKGAGAIETEGSMIAADPSAPADTTTEEPDCEMAGLELDGLMYSPGGTRLPHPCDPYHPTLNNPFAVRCIDAWPWYKTPFPGDEYCILPPEPGKGIQLGVHPQGTDWYAQVSTGDLSGYEDPDVEFLMEPGEEEERNYLTSSPNPEPIDIGRSYTRMRAGSHHMIVSASDPRGGQRGTWSAGDSSAGLFGSTSLPGAQRPDENSPPTLDIPAEDRGLYAHMGGEQDVIFNMHHFNSTDQTTLKEAWENLWFAEDPTTPVIGIFGLPSTQPLQTFASPGETVDVHGSFSIGEEVRVLSLFGHRHAWTGNFSSWVVRAGTEDEEILYQSFDWFDQPTYRFDSITQNPTPAPDKRLDGGKSGILVLQPGDRLHFNCHMMFTDERAASEQAPAPDSIGPLRFANQAFKGEMCILWGSTVEKSIGRPTVDATPLPDFATVE